MPILIKAIFIFDNYFSFKDKVNLNLATISSDIDGTYASILTIIFSRSPEAIVFSTNLAMSGPWLHLK